MARSNQVERILSEVNDTPESPRETVEHVVSYLEGEVADDLRSVVFYGPEGYEVLYARLDIHPDRARGNLEGVLGHVRSTLTEDETSPFAAHRSTIHQFETSSLVHLPLEGERGIVAAFEPARADALGRIVDQCTTML